jgi:hypothetical protein
VAAFGSSFRLASGLSTPSSQTKQNKTTRLVPPLLPLQPNSISLIRAPALHFKNTRSTYSSYQSSSRLVLFVSHVSLSCLIVPTSPCPSLTTGISSVVLPPHRAPFLFLITNSLPCRGGTKSLQPPLPGAPGQSRSGTQSQHGDQFNWWRSSPGPGTRGEEVVGRGVGANPRCYDGRNQPQARPKVASAN